MWRLDRVRHRMGQQGTSLIEVAIAIMIIGLSLLSLVSLLYSTMASSASHRAIVRAGERASEIAEQIDGLRYVPCPGAGSPSALLYRAVLDIDADRVYDERVVQVDFLQDQEASSSSFGPCVAAGDQGAQRITIEVKARNSHLVSSTLTFVKRDTTCPMGSVEVTC